MTVHYPIVLETETSGAVSAYVPGLPVYAAADTYAKAERTIRTVLMAYLEAHPGCRTSARVRIARFTDEQQVTVDIVDVGAGLGGHRRQAKAYGSRSTAGSRGRARRPKTGRARTKSSR